MFVVCKILVYTWVMFIFIYFYYISIGFPNDFLSNCKYAFCVIASHVCLYYAAFSV